MTTVRRVMPDEVEPLHAILVACGRELEARFGLTHWVPPRSLDELRADATGRSVYAVEEEEEASLATGSALLRFRSLRSPRSVVGCFTLGPTPMAHYPDGTFDPAGDPARYLNRLAIDPARQGAGLGAWCVREAERIALVEGARSLRFDAVAAHEVLRAFYRRLGYRECGPAAIRGVPVVCFERLLG